ncbi:MAG: hypothetical protein JXJ19_08330 [Elusimicrobia bacterium]|nr:hypothetical protein [Elusimicrobiota bacterium]
MKPRSLLLLFFLAGCSGHPGGLESRLLSDYRLTDHRKKGISSTYIYEKPEGKIFIERLACADRASMEKTVREDMLTVKMLYSDTLSPYPGYISYRITADKSVLPEYREKGAGDTYYRYFLLYSNDRLSLGITSMDAASHRYLHGWITRSGNNILYRVKIFEPLDTGSREIEEIFFSLVCRD